MGWIEAKTDWDPTKDRLNPESYNRIRNNLAVLGELVNEIYAPLTLESMGEEKNYSSWYYAREFNVFERNLDAINQTCLLYTSPSPRDLSTSRMPSSA